MLEASTTLFKPPRKEDDGNTSPSTYGGMRCRESAEAISRSHDHNIDQQERCNQTRYSNAHFDYSRIVNNE